MSKVTASDQLDNLKPEELQRFLSMYCQDVTRTINGNLDFQQNFNCKVLSVDFAAANTSTAATHGLGRVATSYIPISKSVACDIYSADGSTSSVINLKSTAIATVTLVIF